MPQLKGWVASWSDGSKSTVLSIWETQSEAQDACQQDVRDGEDMSGVPDDDTIDEDQRHVLDWENDGDIEFVELTADAGNGQGTYTIELV